MVTLIIAENTLSKLEEQYAYLVERLALKRSQTTQAFAFATV